MLLDLLVLFADQLFVDLHLVLGGVRILVGVVDVSSPNHESGLVEGAEVVREG